MEQAAIIITFMKMHPLHAWDITPSQACKLQRLLAGDVDCKKPAYLPSTIAGIDVSVSRIARKGRAAIVVLTYPSLIQVDTAVFEGDINFPYIPGLLSFREAPLIIEAWKQLKVQPGMVMVDGQGIAHPRRFGIASHLGLLLDLPTIGCAKSRLTGIHAEVPAMAGSHADLIDDGEVIGAVVRTRSNVKPLYISIGHKINLASCIEVVLGCCRGYRLPEPTRMAHMAAGRTQLPSVKYTGKQEI